MEAMFSAAAALVGAPNAQFLALLFIGGAIGWCTMKLSHLMHSNVAAGALLLSAVTGGWLEHFAIYLTRKGLNEAAIAARVARSRD